MKVVFYTHTSYFDAALCFVREMSRRVELHVLLEVAPEAWQRGFFELEPRGLPAGLVPADPILREGYPPGVRAYWKDAASFNLVVHTCRRSIHPAAWAVSRRAARFIRNVKPDLLHLDDVSLRLGWAIPQFGKIPICLSLHDAEPHSGEHNWRTDLARSLAFWRVTEFVLHNRTQREAFCASYHLSPVRVGVIPLGIYDVFREWSERHMPERRPTVLFFGRLSAYKGLEVLFDAAPRVASHVPNVRFVVAGRPVEGYRLPDAPRLPNGGQVDLLDRYITNPELARLFQDATVVACPYIDATQSGVVMTAFAFGKPVVATRAGGLPEYVEDQITGLLISEQDPVRLAEALVRLLNDRALRRSISGNIRRVAGDALSWAAIAEKTMETYDHVLRQNGHNALSRQ